MKEYSMVTPVAEKYKEWKENNRAMEEARELMEDPGLEA